MKRDSELRFLVGCLGLAGETRKEVIRNAVHWHGVIKPLHWTVEKNTAGSSFKAVFGEAP